MNRDWFALIFTMTFPTVMAWAYFVALARPTTTGAATEIQRPVGNPAIKAAFSAGKTVQFTFPLLWVWGVTHTFPRPVAPTARGLTWGLAFGLMVAGAVFVVYRFVLHDSRLLRDAPAQIQRKLADFGLASAGAYILFACFLSVVHSLGEEYYWRWFVFGRLREYLPVGAAIMVASLAFMAHHVIVLGGFFPGKFWQAVVPLSLCVAAGGAFWAWLYQRTGSLYAPWLSHLVIDGAVMAVGYNLAFG